MVKLYIMLSKKNLAAIMAGIIIFLIFICKFFSVSGSGIDASTNALRLEYIRTLGCTPQETPVTVKKITVPEKFGNVYEKYNQIQTPAGFDLAAYKGKNAVLYTYSIENKEDTVVNLIVYDDEVIGGDISSVRIDGEMKPLIKSND